MEHRLDWSGGKLTHVSPEGVRTELGVTGETDACRKLLELGLANIRDTIMTFRGDSPCFRCQVKWGSEHVVASSGNGTPCFVRLTPARSGRTGVGRGRDAKTLARLAKSTAK